MKFAVLRSLFAVFVLALAPGAVVRAQTEDLNIQTLFEKAGSLMEEKGGRACMPPDQSPDTTRNCLSARPAPPDGLRSQHNRE